MTFDLRSRTDRELRVLSECARADVRPDGAARLRALAAAGLDWDRLLDLAQHNRLVPLLAWHMGRTCPEAVPPQTLAWLNEYFRRNAALTTLLTGELLRLLRRLRAAGIDAIPFKGPALAMSAYGHPALREFCDLDIIVRERHVREAGRLLEAEGFEPDLPIPEDRRAAFIRQDYVALYQRDAGRTLVELHWGISPRDFGVRLDAGALWDRLETGALQGAQVPIVSPEDLVLLLAVHGGRHGFERLERLSVLAEIVRHHRVDWSCVWQRARRMHCRRMLTVGLLLAHGVLDVPLPRGAETAPRSRSLMAMAETMAHRFAAGESGRPTSAGELAMQLRLKDTRLDQLRQCAGLVFRPTPNDWSAVPLNRSLSFAYPIVRLLRLAWKHGRTPWALGHAGN